MATITTTAYADPVIYPPNFLMDQNPFNAGVLYMAVRMSTTTIQVFRSPDSGATWATYGGLITRTGLVELCGIIAPATPEQWLYICYRVNESSLDKVYTARMRIATSPTWGSEQLVASAGNGGVAGAVYTGVAMYTYYEFNLWTHQAFAVGTQNGAVQGVKMFGAYWAPNGTFTATGGSGPFQGTTEWYPTTGTGRIGPSIDVEHIGDRHTSNYQPHLWVSWGRTSLYLVKMPYGGNRCWSGPTQPITVDTGFTAQDAVTGRWDNTSGGRFIMCMPNKSTTGGTDTVAVYERDKANSITIMRITPAHTTGVIRQCTVAINATTGDLRVYAVGTSTALLYYVDYVRATGLWTSWATVDASAVLGSTGANFGVRPSTYGNAKFTVYKAFSAVNTVESETQGLTFAPNAPTWVNITGQSADVAQALLLDWLFSDADPGDAQTRYAVSRQIGAGALAYWRASDSTWQVAEVQNITGTTQLSLAAGWGTGADAPHTYRAKVWDNTTTASQYGDALVVIASAVVSPTIVTPTPAQVLTGDSVTLTWTVSEQTNFRVVLTETVSGLLLHDSGWINSTSLLTYTPPVSLATGLGYTITLQTTNNEGLPSVIQTRNFSVAFITPNTPTLVATAVPASGWIAVVITNPAPSGGAPTVTSNDVYRRVVGDTSDGIRIATAVANSGTYNDWRAVSGVAYEYRILARGSNGTSGFGAWTA